MSAVENNWPEDDWDDLPLGDPLAELERLQREYVSAQSSGDLHAANVGRANQTIARLTRERVSAHKEAARGREGAAERVEQVEQELAEATAYLDREQAASEGALQARREVEEEIARLRKVNLAQFAAEAEQLTEQARDALLELEDPYRRAVEAWDHARAKWAPLANAIREQVVESNERDGVYATVDPAVAAVPPFPLPEPGGVFEAARAGSLAARPEAIRPTHHETTGEAA